MYTSQLNHGRRRKEDRAYGRGGRESFQLWEPSPDRVASSLLTRRLLSTAGQLYLCPPSTTSQVRLGHWLVAQQIGISSTSLQRPAVYSRCQCFVNRYVSSGNKAWPFFLKRLTDYRFTSTVYFTTFALSQLVLVFLSPPLSVSSSNLYLDAHFLRTKPISYKYRVVFKFRKFNWTLLIQ